MKLATLKNGTRDGQLIVVSRDLTRQADASDVAPFLQYALDHWDMVSARLEARFEALDRGHIAGSPFDAKRVAAPLPRAYQWLDASVYTTHLKLMARAFGHDPEPSLARQDPLVYQGGSDSFLGALDPIVLLDEAAGLDFEGEVGVVVGDVPMGASREVAASRIRLLVLINDISQRAVAPAEMAAGFGWLHAKPSSSFSPVAVTPDELGASWVGGRIGLPLRVQRDGELFGHPDAGEMSFAFPDIISYVARTRSLIAGSIIGSGTVSNENYRDVGSACIAERRAIEMIEHGAARTNYLRAGETVRMEILDREGHSIFGAIEQVVTKPAPPNGRR